MSRNGLVAVFVLAVMLAMGFSEASGQVLTQSGPCPGTKTFTVTGGAPFTRYAFIHAANTGSWVVPGGLVCAGTVTGLAAPVTLAGYVPANAGGTAVVTVNIPPPVCGNRYLQVVDAMVCTTSNVILIN